MTSDERYAQLLRERYAAPELHVDPEVVVRRGRVRRAWFRTVAGGAAAVALVAVVAGGLSLAPDRGQPDPGQPDPGPAAADATPPPESAADEAFLAFSPSRVTPGSELTVAFVNRGEAELIGGVLLDVSRWEGDRWVAVGTVGLCLQEWGCAGRVTPEDSPAVNSIGITAPPGGASFALRLTTDGLEPGWYRFSTDLLEVAGTTASGANELRHVLAHGQLEITADAPPAPPPPTSDAASLEVTPAVLTPAGGRVTAGPVVPAGADGSLTHEDLVAAVAGLSTTVRLDRWTDGAWRHVGDVEADPDPDDELRVRVDVPQLPSGDYRLARTGPEDELSGRFQVVDTGPVYEPFRPDEPVPAHLRDFAARVAESRADPNAPEGFRAHPDLASCGTTIVDQGVVDGTWQVPVPWDCLAVGRAFGAEYVFVSPTTEGDPIIVYYRSGPWFAGGFEGYNDSSADRYGAEPAWIHGTCLDTGAWPPDCPV